MVVGFLLLAMVSASLAAMFVREEEQPRDDREEASDKALLAALAALERRLAAIETRLMPADTTDLPRSPPAPDQSWTSQA
jgi:hypothetical protein